MSDLDLSLNLLNINFDDLTDLQIIGKGANGEVFKGGHRLLGTELAIKVFKVSNPSEEEALMKELSNEIEIMASCKHPNIVNCYGACSAPPNLAIVMEHCPNSLFNFIHDKDFQMDLPLLLRWGSDIVSGMLYLHDVKKSIHRDLKTGNLLISKQNSIKITDFGVSRIKEASTAQPMTMIGTIEYMAPEIALEAYSYPVDIYGFGVVIWEMATQERPYAKSGIPRLALVYRQTEGLRPGGHFKEDGTFEWTLPLPDWCPRELSDLIVQCWDPDPLKRPTFNEIYDIFFKLEGKTPMKEISTSGEVNLSRYLTRIDAGAGSSATTVILSDAEPELIEWLQKWISLDCYVHLKIKSDDDDDEDEEEDDDDDDDDDRITRKIRIRERLSFDNLRKAIIDKFELGDEERYDHDSLSILYYDKNEEEMEMKDNDDFADCIKSSVEDIHVYVSITEYEVDEEDDEEEEEEDAEEGDEPEEEEEEK